MLHQAHHRISLTVSSSIIALLLLATGASTAFASTTSYLRPNGDIATSEPWSIVGASSAWSALDDNITESETPGTSDYISTAQLSPVPSTAVELSSLSLAGQKPLSASAWFYTTTSTSTTFTVAAKGEKTESSQTFTGSGWHSLTIPFSITQTVLNTLSLKFAPGSGSGTRQIPAAFVRVTIEPPAHSIYWGAWMDGEVYTKEGEKTWGDAPWDQTTWNAFEANAGRAPSLVHFGQPPPWTQSFAEEPLSLTAKRGAIPFMDMSSTGASLEELQSGKLDASLREWAVAAKKYEKPFFFRFDWEMNGTWFPWGAEAAKNTGSFKNAWRHFHDIVEEEGATNVTWVWCPNVLFEGSTPLTELYPGDSYVDWTCMDGYNRGEGKEGVSFSSLFKTTYSELLSIGPSKPIMIGETASTEKPGSKANWIEAAFGTSLPNSFPSVKAVAWFNWNIYDEKTGGRWDWPIESSKAAQAAFANIISSPYYAANEFGSLTPLTHIKPLP
jgi:Glycosyl hydrolase family 26